MPGAGDEELNGAVAALLGLHSRTSRDDASRAAVAAKPAAARASNPNDTSVQISQPTSSRQSSGVRETGGGTRFFHSPPPAAAPAERARTAVDCTTSAPHADATTLTAQSYSYSFYPAHAAGVSGPYLEVPLGAELRTFSDPSEQRSNFVRSSSGWARSQLRAQAQEGWSATRRMLVDQQEPCSAMAYGRKAWAFGQPHQRTLQPVESSRSSPTPPASVACYSERSTAHAHFPQRKQNVALCSSVAVPHESQGGPPHIIHHQQKQQQQAQQQQQPTENFPHRHKQHAHDHQRHHHNYDREVLQQRQQQALHQCHETEHQNKQVIQQTNQRQNLRHQQRSHVNTERGGEKQQQRRKPDEPQRQQQQQQQQQQPKQQPKQKEPQAQQPSINSLWSLIPGTLLRDGAGAGTGVANHLSIGETGQNIRTGGEMDSSLNVGNPIFKNNDNGSSAAKYPKHDTAQNPPASSRAGVGALGWQHPKDGSLPSGRCFPPDVHQPLSDSARRHRARAVARLRIRRRALAAATEAAAAANPTAATGKRQMLDITAERDGSSDGENDPSAGGGENCEDLLATDDASARKQTKTARDSGSTSGVCDNRVVVPGATSTGGTGVARGTSESSAGADANRGRDDSSGRGEYPTSGEGRESRSRAAGGTTVTCAGDNGVDVAGGAPAVNAIPAGSVTSEKRSSSKVGELLQLMHSVRANFEGGGGSGRSDGTAVESREIGRPVKYKYRQEAARSRKRTRGRFVSEKAPAFVSITELMALRRAERERQQQDDSTPVSVGAGSVMEA